MEHRLKTCEDLPPECLLRVIEYLTLADVTVLLKTSNFWNSIISQNENTIYCRLASSQEPNIAPIGSLDTALARWLSPATTQVKNWKQYCENIGLDRDCDISDDYAPQAGSKLTRDGDGSEKI